ncbi:MAG: cytochrome c biogenesis protein ResB [Anaerolineae bacterium]
MLRSRSQNRRLDHILNVLWYALSAPQVTAAVLLLLALLVGLAALFPQLPSGLNSAEADRQLTALAARFPASGSPLRALGAFELLSSIWLRVLLATLALNLALRTAAQASFLWRLQRGDEPPPPPRRVVFRRAVLPGPLTAISDRVYAALDPHYDTIRMTTDPDGGELFAQRRPLAAGGPLLAYVGLLVLLAGLAINDGLSWRAREITLGPGDTVTLEQPAAPQITLEKITGDDVNASSDVILSLRGRSRRLWPAAAQAAAWGNLWVAQQATGPALTVTAEESSGRAAVLQSLAADKQVGPSLRLLFGQTQSEQGFAIPIRNLTFRAVSYAALPDQGIQQPVFLVEAYQGEEATPAATGLITDEGQLLLDDLRLNLRRDRYAVLEVAYLPGLLPLALGGLLVLAGTMLSASGGMTRIWARFGANGQQVLAIVGATGPATPQKEIEWLLRVARGAEELTGEDTHGA